MAYREEPYEMPCGVEAAVFRLAAASEKDGMRLFSAFFKDHRPESVTFYEDDGTTTLVALIDGEWHEWVDVV